LIQADALVDWVEPDQILFARGGALFAQRFDTKNLTFTGSPRMVTDSVAFQTVSSAAQATCSRQGILAFKVDEFPARQLTWFDRTGQPTGTLGPPMKLQNFRLSLDERSVAVSKLDSRTGTWNLWQAEVSSGSEERLGHLVALAQ